MKCVAGTDWRRFKGFAKICGKKAEFMVNGDSLCREHMLKKIND